MEIQNALATLLFLLLFITSPLRLKIWYCWKLSIPTGIYGQKSLSIHYHCISSTQNIALHLVGNTLLNEKNEANIIHGIFDTVISFLLLDVFALLICFLLVTNCPIALFFKNFTHLFLVALGLHCCAGFSSCAEQRCFLVECTGFALRWLLVTEHGHQSTWASVHMNLCPCSTEVPPSALLIATF